jgi:hypothetical protein
MNRPTDEKSDEDEEPIVANENGGIRSDHVNDAHHQKRTTSTESVRRDSSYQIALRKKFY